jgi:hypothetical protein
LAATFVELGKHSSGGLNFHHIKVTADAATAVYTLPSTGTTIPKLLGLSFPFKTTGSASAITAVYVEATGVLTIAGLTNADVLYVTMMY